MLKGKIVKIGGWGNYPGAEQDIITLSSISDPFEVINRVVIRRGLGRSYSDQAINTVGPVALCTKTKQASLLRSGAWYFTL